MATIKKQLELSYSEGGTIDYCMAFNTVSEAVKYAKQVLKDNEDMKGNYLVFDSEDNLMASIWRWSYNGKIDIKKYKKGEFN